jgi:hypothetical protein
MSGLTKSIDKCCLELAAVARALHELLNEDQFDIEVCLALSELLTLPS